MFVEIPLHLYHIAISKLKRNTRNEILMNKNPNAEQKGVRVFESDFLESLTHVHPAAPIIVWGPVTLYFLYDGSTKLPSAAEMILFIFMGVLTWTFIEYIFHRYLFHFPAKSKLSKRLVFYSMGFITMSPIAKQG